jgi:hypothetical protein
MRRVTDLSQIQNVVRQTQNAFNKISTHDWDRSGTRLTNNAPGVNPNDYVIMAQLPTIPAATPVANQHYTIVFSNQGVPGIGDAFPEYVVGSNRIGTPTEVWIRGKVSPVGGPFTVTVTKNNINILTTNLILPATQSGPVYQYNFTLPIPNFGKGDVIGGSVVTANNVSVWSVGVVVQIQPSNGQQIGN